MNSSTKKIIIILLCLLVFSCVKRQVVRQAVLEPYTGPVTVETLRKSIVFRNVRTIKSSVDVKIFRDMKPAGDLSGIFVYKSPGHMRLSLFGPFGVTVLDFLLSKDLFQTYIPPKNIIYEWSSSDASFNALLDDRFSYSMAERGDDFVLYAYIPGNNSELIAEYSFDNTYLLNRSIIFYRRGREIARLYFDDFNGRNPGHIKLLFITGMSMEISLNQPEFDSDVPNSYFRPVDHANRTVLPLQDILSRFEPNP
ncbi:MAG: hypothetical protein VST72_01520 [Nitrospirota bacterium]|nr:hypothetical protein [Nitrospirota bacterium]